jgi:hypothetical protein
MKLNLGMDFLKKLLARKTTAADVLKALESFANDQKSLNYAAEKAKDYFGDNWKFNLEMYIRTLPQPDREKYSRQLGNLIDFDRALSLWISAEQVIRGTRTFSGEMLGRLPEYEKYLPKFGIEGRRLLEKFKTKLDMNGGGKSAAKTPARTEEPAKPAADEIKSTGKILVKVGKEELAESAAEPLELPKPETPEAVLEEEAAEKEENGDGKTRPVENHIKIKEGADGSDWDIQRFLNLHNFLSSSREVMSAVVLEKNVSALENYPHYGFILDALDMTIADGNRILKEKTDEEIKKYLKGGRDELENIIDFYISQKAGEVVAPAKEDKPEDGGEKAEYTKVNQAAES